MKNVPARIDGLLAREADVAVVFRRGPSKWTRCLRWNLETDEVEPGQWIAGRVYSRRCDLSPDGELLVGAFTNYSRSHAEGRAARGEPAFSSWTAVSRPPYFTALALWGSEGSWNLGGQWRGPRELALNLPPSQEFDPGASPRELSVAPLGLPLSEDEPIFSMRLELGGWRTVQEMELRETNPEWRANRQRMMEAMQSGIFTDPSRFGEVMGLMENTMPVYALVQEGLMERAFAGGRLVRSIRQDSETWSVRDDGDRVRREFIAPTFTPQWLDVDRRGRVIYGDQGCLWAWADFPNGEPTRIADLNDQEFEPIEAPTWAREWPEA